MLNIIQSVDITKMPLHYWKMYRPYTSSSNAMASLRCQHFEFSIACLNQGCATGGPRATTRPVRSLSVALINSLIFFHQSIES